MKELFRTFIYVVISLILILLLALIFCPHFTLHSLFHTKPSYTLYVLNSKTAIHRDFNAINISFVDKRNREAFLEILNNSNVSLDTYLSSQLDYYDRLIAFLVVIIGLYALCSYLYIKSISEEKAKKMCEDIVSKEMASRKIKDLIAESVGEQMVGQVVRDQIDSKLDDLLEQKTVSDRTIGMTKEKED